MEENNKNMNEFKIEDEKRYIFIEEPGREEWGDFVFHHPNGTIFQTPEMVDVYRGTKNYYPMVTAVKNTENVLEGVLVSLIQEDYTGILGRLTSRSIVWGGPLVLNNNLTVLNLLLKEYDRRVKNRAIYTQFRNLWNQSEEYKTIFKTNGFEYEDHLNILVDLTKEEDVLWKELEPTGRTAIRKAGKEGLTFQELTEPGQMKETYSMLMGVYKKAGLPLSHQSLFETAIEILWKKNMLKFFGVIFEGKVVGNQIVLAYRERLYEWYAGSYSEYFHKRPNDLLPWEIFMWGKRNGYGIYDFGGAGKPDKYYGVRNYKKKFGGETVELGRFVKTHKPLLMEVGKLGLKVWRKLR